VAPADSPVAASEGRGEPGWKIGNFKREGPDEGPSFRWVRPAQAHSYGCKSRRELVRASEAQLHEGDRMWGGSVERNCGPMNKNRIEADQGERARDREALVTKGRRRKSGGRAVKECVLTWGDLASCLKG